MSEHPEMKELEDHITSFLMDDEKVQELTSKLALYNIDRAYVPVEEDDPKYEQYYTVLALVLQTALGRAIGKAYYAWDRNRG